MHDNADAGIPDGFLHLTSPYALLVEKSSQRLMLYKAQGTTLEQVKTYPCSTGKNRGDKKESGDLKTPEGGYFFTTVHRDEALPSKYGVMAFVLDFPNLMDRQQQKGGNGIWLHGLDKPLVAYDTQGCVAMRNEDITELSRYIGIYETPILITEKIAWVDNQTLQRERQDAMRLIATWRQAWQGKRLQAFLECYSPDRFGAFKLNRLKATKQDLNRRYKFISVDLQRLNVLKHGSTIIAGFVQDYESDDFASTGFKKLYLQRNSDEMKIVGEDWMENAVPRKPSETASEERRIFRKLNQWLGAWERKDIESYMECYAPDFTANGMNRRQWREYKTGVNRTAGKISIAVEATDISFEGKNAVVTFLQRYTSGAHSDYGRKKLTLTKTGSDWKILRETWEPL